MGNLLRRLNIIGANPLIVVEWFIAVATIVGGIYLLTFVFGPIPINTESTLIQVVASKLGIAIFASIYTLSGLGIIAGIVSRKVKVRQISLFWNLLARFYALSAGLIAGGLLPLTWISPLVVLLTVFYIWKRIKARGIE